MAQNKKIEIRIDARTKADVERILKRTGIKMSEAMRIYFQKIIIVNGLPFKIRTRRRSLDEIMKFSPKKAIKYMDNLTEED